MPCDTMSTVRGRALSAEIKYSVSDNLSATSSAPNGSSVSSTSDGWQSALASATLAACPPLILPGSLFCKPSMPRLEKTRSISAFSAALSA